MVERKSGINHIHLYLKSTWIRRFAQENNYIPMDWMMYLMELGWVIFWKMPSLGCFPIHIAVTMKPSSISIVTYFLVLTMACVSWPGFCSTVSRSCCVSGGDSCCLVEMVRFHETNMTQQFQLIDCSKIWSNWNMECSFDLVYCDLIRYNMQLTY